MASTDLEPEWCVEWATPTINDDRYFDNIILSREQAIKYGDELVMALRVDGPMLRERGLDPAEPFAWRIKDGELQTKQISRRTFEEVAEGDQDDAFYAQRVLEYRAKRRLQSARE